MHADATVIRSDRADGVTVLPGRMGRVAGLDGRRQAARRNRELVAAFTAAIGQSVDATTSLKVKRAAELVCAAEQMRAAALRGEDVDPLALVRLEGIADRSIRALDIPAAPTGTRLPPP